MKKLAFILLAAAAFLSALAWQQKPAEKTTEPSAPQKGSSPHAGYEAAWKSIDSLDEKGLYKSAGQAVASLYQKARKEGNMPQLVKAAIYRSYFQTVDDADSLVLAINDLEKDCQEITFPARPVLHSILAEVYWRYYSQNRYRFLDRSETTGIVETDINTWDLQKILNKTVEHYSLSLEPAETLKLFPVDMFDLVIRDGSKDTRELRPLLYDFLAHRAADFFMNSEAGISRPESGFDMNRKEFFVSAPEFVNLVITSPDTMDFQYRALKILQELTKLHIRPMDHDPLIDVDLKRLRFVHNNATVDQEDTIYIAALRNIARQDVKFPESTQALYEIARVYEGYGNDYDIGAEPEKKEYLRKAEEVCDQAIARFPYSHGGLQCKELKARLDQKSLAVTSSLAYTSRENLKIQLRYRNLQKAYVKLVRHTGDGTEPGNETAEKRLKQILKMPEVKKWSLVLPADDDKQEHVTEFKVDSLPLGRYALLVASTENFAYEKQAVTVSEFYVTGLSYFTRKLPDGRLEVQTLHRESGRPMPGVTVNTWISSYDYSSRKNLERKGEALTTDAEGRVFLPALNNYQNIKMEFVNGNDRLFSREEFYQHPVQPEVREFSDQTFFFTDRSIYRPGQTVYFKGLILESNGEVSRIKKGQKTVVYLTDANGQIVSQLNLVSNDYGTFQGTFTAPHGGLTGMMAVANESGLTNISVEEYKRPKFEVAFDPVQGAFRLGDEIIVRGKATTYSGAAVDGAKVRYKVTRQLKWQPWFWRKGISPRGSEVTILQGNALTDASGRFSVSFEARPDFSAAASTDPAFVFTVTADVTDLNGETRSGNVAQEVSYKAVRMDMDVPDQLQKEKAGPWKLVAQNSAGQREVLTGEIIVSRLRQPVQPLRKSSWPAPDKLLLTEQEYATYFPLDERNNADPLKWKKEKEVFRSKFDLAKDSVFRPAVNDWSSGYYLLEVHSRDKYGEDVKIIRPFVLYGLQEKTSPVVEPFWIKPIHIHAEPGSNDSILLATGEDALTVLFELELKGKIVRREWITLNKEQRMLVIPMEESFRGNVTAHFVAVKNNREYRTNETLEVPWTNKELEISLQTFRNKVEPGSKEEWNITVKGKNSDKVVAEMLASMYDASLDAFLPHDWSFSIFPVNYDLLRLMPSTFGNGYTSLFTKDWNEPFKRVERTYDALNWFEFRSYARKARYRSVRSPSDLGVADEVSMQMSPAGKIAGESSLAVADSNGASASAKPGATKESLIKARTNFNETAYFFPQLRTNEKGEVVFSFTLPDALTRWKAQFFAHTQDLAFGLKTLELITQKELMVFSNPPRFVREGDTLELPVKVTSLSATEQQVTASIEFKDALTGKDITEALLGKRDRAATFPVAAGQSSVVAWKIGVPRTLQAVSYTVSAKATNHSDAETMTFPVLTDRMLITEAIPFSLRPMQSKDVTFTRMKENTSSTLQHHSLTFEYTGNPAWYAVQALPYLMEYPYECSEQVFSRYYANTLAAHIANNSPAIQSVFEQWKQGGKESFLSNLEKNQELKNILLEESPWVRDAANEKEQRQRIALLFDLNKMSSERQAALQKLAEQQSSNGGWPWFQGMPENRYITQYIVEGLGHLDHLKVADVRKDERVYSMVTRAVAYCDQRMAEDYKELQRRKVDLSKPNITSFEIHYLYARSFFPEITMNADARKASQYYSGQAKKFWLDFELSLQAMIALSLSRQQDAATPGDILKSLRERAKSSEDMGMYWPANESGFRWSQATVETQAVLIEAFTELGKNNSEVDDMKLWLLKNKQTNSWKTTKATAEACYALLLSGTDWLSSQNPPQVTVGSMNVEAKAEAGTGYFKQSWTGPEITTDMANVRVKNQNNNPAWGALYWQYFEDMDKITSDGMPLRIARKIFVERVKGKNTVAELITDTTTLRPGDRIKMRVIIQADRDMEYVHVKDLRAAGFEPENVLSGYRYQDGLGYYESTRDAATNFFIGFLPKGMYVFEYPVRAAQRGSYSNGVATIQCMYAPEFSAHSDGFRVTIAGE